MITYLTIEDVFEFLADDELVLVDIAKVQVSNDSLVFYRTNNFL